MIIDSFKRKLIIGLLLLALFSPLGLILPDMIKSKTPFGEASGDSLKKELGFLPTGLNKTEKLWKAPVKDYNISKKNQSMLGKTIIYLGSGLLGISIIAVATILLQKMYRKNE
jgi:hypothetical protein